MCIATRAPSTMKQPRRFRPNTKPQRNPDQMNTTFDNNDDQHDPVDQACLHVQNKNYPAAERILRQVLAADPKNCPALNALGVLYKYTGRHSQALEALRLAMAIHPTDPNAYYNLASLLHQGGRSEESLPILEQLFAKAEPCSPSSVTIYSHAITLCERVHDALATKNHPATSEAVESFRRSVESLTGYPVVVASEDLPPATGSVTETALRCGQAQHLIRCNRSFPDTLRQHFIARGLMQIELEWRAHSAGKAVTFTIQERGLRFLVQPLLGQQLPRLKAHVHVEESTRSAALERARGILVNLFTCPTDLIVETTLRQRIPILGSAQFLATGGLLRQAPDPKQVLSKEDIMPKPFLYIDLALNCVRAKLHDLLFRDTTGFALAYADTAAAYDASQLWELWRASASSLADGDEYRLVDDFGILLGINPAYQRTNLPMGPLPPGTPSK